ncbi:AP2 domain transcription factor AP2X-5 [Toxoplasma gondii ARI]|uniref:AP2 domain transcription factor AP2X-5 n=1 Tax=Toxoplasma gondii ARI TaxID=1074872 RepID=A0A139XWE1_TOXGO|nr:AP2 domain transcription factor AP2X-5 [Toxoplasma gondii ARI]
MATFQIDALDMGSEAGAESQTLDRSSPFPFSVFNSSGAGRWEDSTHKAQETGFYPSSQNVTRDHASPLFGQPPFSGQNPASACSTTGTPLCQDDGRNGFLHATQSHGYPSKTLSHEFSLPAPEAHNPGDAGYYRASVQREHDGCTDSAGMEPTSVTQQRSSNQHSTVKDQHTPPWFQSPAPDGDTSVQSYGYILASQGVDYGFPDTSFPPMYPVHHEANSSSVIRNPQENRTEEPGSHPSASPHPFSPMPRDTSATGNGMPQHAGEDSIAERMPPSGKNSRPAGPMEWNTEFAKAENSLKAAAEELYSHLPESAQRPRRSPSPDFGHKSSGKGKARAHPYAIPVSSSSGGTWSCSSVPPFCLPAASSENHRQAEKGLDQEARALTEGLSSGECVSGFPLSSDMEGASPSLGANCRSSGYTLSRKPTDSTTHPSFSSSSSQSFSPPLSSSRDSPRLEPKPAPGQLPEDQQRAPEDRGFLRFLLPPRQERQEGSEDPSLFSGDVQMQRTDVEGDERQVPRVPTSAGGEHIEEDHRRQGQLESAGQPAASGAPAQRLGEGAGRGSEEVNALGVLRECLGEDRQADEEGDAHRRALEAEAPPSVKRRRGPAQPAKMYFHKKKEAWRAEVLIDGTKRQKSFSCKVYGEPRARMLCEWARRFARDFGRLPSNQDVANYIPCLPRCRPAPRGNDDRGEPATQHSEGSYFASFPHSFAAHAAPPDIDAEDGASAGPPCPQGPFFAGGVGAPDCVQTHGQMRMFNSAQANSQGGEFRPFLTPEGWRETDSSREMWQKAHGSGEGAGTVEISQNSDQMSRAQMYHPAYSPYGQMPQQSYYAPQGMGERPDNEVLTFPVQPAASFPISDDTAWSARPEAFWSAATAASPHQPQAWIDGRRKDEGLTSFENFFSGGPNALGWPQGPVQGGEELQRRFACTQDARQDVQTDRESHAQGTGLRASPPDFFYADSNASNAPRVGPQPFNVEAECQERMRVERAREGRARLGEVLERQSQVPVESAGDGFEVQFGNPRPQSFFNTHFCGPGGPHMPPFQMYASSDQPGAPPQQLEQALRGGAVYPNFLDGRSPQKVPQTSCPPSPFSSSTCAGASVASFPSSSVSAAGVSGSALAAATELPFSPFPSPFISDGPLPPLPFSAPPYASSGDEVFLRAPPCIPSGQAGGPSQLSGPFYLSSGFLDTSAPYYSPPVPQGHATPAPHLGMCYHPSLASGSTHGRFYGQAPCDRSQHACASGPTLGAVELAAEVAATALSTLDKQSFDSLFLQTLQELNCEKGGAAGSADRPRSLDLSFTVPLPLLHQASSLLNQMEDPFSGIALDPFGQGVATLVLPATSDYLHRLPFVGASAVLPMGRPAGGESCFAPPEASGCIETAPNPLRGGEVKTGSVFGDTGEETRPGEADASKASCLERSRAGGMGEEGEGERHRKTSGCGDEDEEGFSAFVQKRREMNIAAGARFEELDGLKSLTRPRGGRTKRFNVGKKPFSGVRGIYFQQGAWKVRYRGDQEEVLKVFPYASGDFDSMWFQFLLARQFLRQVIAKGRQLHDSDGEGLSDEEPAWILRHDAASASSATRRADSGRPRRGLQASSSSSRSSSLSASQSRQGRRSDGSFVEWTSATGRRRNDPSADSRASGRVGRAVALSGASLGSLGETAAGEGADTTGGALSSFLGRDRKCQERGPSQSGACRRLDAAVESLRPISSTDFFEPIFFPALFGPASEKWGVRADRVRDDVEDLEKQRLASPHARGDNGDSGDSVATMEKSQGEAACGEGEKRRRLSREVEGSHASKVGEVVEELDTLEKCRRSLCSQEEKDSISDSCATEQTVGTGRDCGEKPEVEGSVSLALDSACSLSAFSLSFAGSEKNVGGEPQVEDGREEARTRADTNDHKSASVSTDAFDLLQEPTFSKATSPTGPSREKEFQLVASYPWDLSGEMLARKASPGWHSLPHLPLLLQDRHDRVLASSFWS